MSRADVVTAENASETVRPNIALLALGLGFFIIQVDVTIVNVVLEPIRRELGGGLTGQQWVISGYTIALAAGMLFAGELGDRYGARRSYVAGAAAFAFASALCSLAPDIQTLVAARVLQGVGAAALLPSSLALVVHLFPEPRARTRAIGIWGGVSALGMSAGPVVGSVLVPFAGWRSVFWVNVPICLVAAVMVRRFASESPKAAGRKLDLVGTVTGTAALAAVVAGFIEAGEHGWTAWLPVALALAGLVLAAVFLLARRRTSEPLLPQGMFTSARFSAGTVVGGLFNFCMYGTLLCVSLFLQGPLGRSSAQTGLAILPFTALIFCGSFLSSKVAARFGPRLPMLLGFGFALASAVTLGAVGTNGPALQVTIGFAIMGLQSLAMPTMTAVVMSAAPEGRAGLASGVLNTARQAGGALGAAVAGSLLVVGQARGGMDLFPPMGLIAIGYALAIAATLVATKAGSSPR